MLLLLCTPCAHAGESFPDKPWRVYVGVHHQLGLDNVPDDEIAPLCRSDRVTGRVGLEYDVYRQGDLDVSVVAEHDSCITSDRLPTQNTIGVQWSMEF